MPQLVTSHYEDVYVVKPHSAQAKPQVGTSQWAERRTENLAHHGAIIGISHRMRDVLVAAIGIEPMTFRL